jgi:hypothetical protein
MHQWQEGGNTYLRICAQGRQQNHNKITTKLRNNHKTPSDKIVPAGSNV